VCVIYRYIEVRIDGRKTPMVMCIFGCDNAIRPHVQTWATEIPRLVIPETDWRAWPGSTFLNISAAVANVSVVPVGAVSGLPVGPVSLVQNSGIIPH